MRLFDSVRNKIDVRLPLIGIVMKSVKSVILVKNVSRPRGLGMWLDVSNWKIVQMLTMPTGLLYIWCKNDTVGEWEIESF